MDLGISGLASGFDWKSFIDQMTEISRAPQKRLLVEQNQISQRNNALSSIKTQIGVLAARVDTLKGTNIFGVRASAVADETIAKVSASGPTPLGTYALNVTQLATAAKQRGLANIGSPLATSSDVSGLVLANAGFSTDVRAGTFTINNEQITIATTDTL